MAVRTVRFNKEEESKLKVLLAYYHSDFSSCVKELFVEKLEDLQDMGVIKKIWSFAHFDDATLFNSQ